MIRTHNAEIRAIMQAHLNGEINEADSARTIILLQRDLISALLSQLTLSEAPAGLTEETTLLNSEAA